MTAEGWNIGAKKANQCQAVAGKHMSAAMDVHATVEELFKTMFYMWFVSRLCSENGQGSHELEEGV
jgi:hypothetical protein